MLYPITVADDFFAKPYSVKELSNKFNFTPCGSGYFPGVRSEQLGSLKESYSFFNYTCQKILSIIYPESVNDIQYSAELYFQKISNEFKNPGFIHTDSIKELTSIIYLSPHDSCGTNFYDPIGEHPIDNPELRDSKFDIYKNKNFTNEAEIVNKLNRNFKKTLTVPSKFNRMVLFDGSYLHGVENFIDEKVNEDRLTLIAFFHHITKNGIRYPMVENKRRL